MFDDQIPSSGIQQEPQDIFSETSPVSQSQQQAPAQSPTPSHQMSTQEHHSGFNSKLILIIVVILAVLVIAAFGVQFALRNQQKPLSQLTPAPLSAPEPQVPPTPAPVTATQPQAVQLTPPQPGVQEVPNSLPGLPAVGNTVTAPDADMDGLSDEEEMKLGTDSQKNDTDGDTLNDGDEVKKYKTNPLIADSDADGLDDNLEVQKYLSDPLNPDSDGDGYLDGAEVKSGYSPTGNGKLQQ